MNDTSRRSHAIITLFSHLSEEFRNIFDVDRTWNARIYETRGTLVVAELSNIYMQDAVARTLSSIFRQWKNHRDAAAWPLTMTLQYVSNHRVIGTVKQLPGTTSTIFEFTYVNNFYDLVAHIMTFYPLRTLMVTLRWGSNGLNGPSRNRNSTYSNVVNADTYHRPTHQRHYTTSSNVVNADTYHRPTNQRHYTTSSNVVNADTYHRPTHQRHYTTSLNVVNANDYRSPWNVVNARPNLSNTTTVQPSIASPNPPIPSSTIPSPPIPNDVTFVRNANGVFERNALSLDPIPRRFLWRATARSRSGVETSTVHDARAMARLIDFQRQSGEAVITNPVTRARLSAQNVREIMRIAGSERV
jgi:hypothetical protein